jgi:hypothetical protein
MTYSSEKVSKAQSGRSQSILVILEHLGYYSKTFLFAPKLIFLVPMQFQHLRHKLSLLRFRTDIPFFPTFKTLIVMRSVLLSNLKLCNNEPTLCILEFRPDFFHRSNAPIKRLRNSESLHQWVASQTCQDRRVMTQPCFFCCFITQELVFSYWIEAQRDSEILHRLVQMYRQSIISN